MQYNTYFNNAHLIIVLNIEWDYTWLNSTTNLTWERRLPMVEPPPPGEAEEQ